MDVSNWEVDGCSSTGVPSGTDCVPSGCLFAINLESPDLIELRQPPYV